MAEGCISFTVVSSSSHTKHNAAENIARDDLGDLWQTEVGEEKASVFIHLSTSSILHTIEIVNAGSSNIEIYVSNSPQQGEDEETLLPTASLMTFGEINSHVNRDRVRFFGPDKLTKGVASKAWKYMRILCISFDTSRGPFGLARVRLFESAPPADYVANAVAHNSSMAPAPTPAQATHKPCAPRSKSFVASTPKSEKQDLTNNNTNSKPHNTNNTNHKHSNNTNNNDNNNNNPNNHTENGKTASTPQTKRKRVIMNDDYEDDGNNNNIPDKNHNSRSMTSLHLSPMTKKQPPANRSKSLVLTPFNKIMSDVVIVVSGIANPERQDLRDKALEMGAQYYPDWIESATHLICRFANTPKFVAAQKSGGITVTPGWILDCYANKVRLPETEYLLAEEKRDTTLMKSTMGSMRDWLSTFKPNLNKTASNASTASTATYNINNNSNPLQRRTKSLTFINGAMITKELQREPSMDDNSSASTEPMSDNDNEPPTKMIKKESAVGSALTDTTEDMGPTQDTVELSASEDETTNKQKTHSKMITKTTQSGPLDTTLPLPDYFKQVKATLVGNFDPAMKALLIRYITAYAGDIDSKADENTTHLITNQVWGAELQKLQEQYPTVCIVRPSWVFDSHNEQRLVDIGQHIVQQV